MNPLRWLWLKSSEPTFIVPNPPIIAAEETASHAPVEIAVPVSFSPSTIQFLEGQMSALSDQIAALTMAVTTASASADALLTRIQTTVATDTTTIAGLNATIATLQTEVAAGSATPDDIAALTAAQASVAAIQAKLDAADPTNPAVLPTPVPAGS